MAVIDRLSGREEEPDRFGPGEPVDRGDTATDRPISGGRDVVAELESDYDWDTGTGHLTDEDRKRYLDADPRQVIPEAELERMSRQRALYDYVGERANLDNFLFKDPAEYVRTNAEQRPWLQPALGGDRYLQRVFASIDTGGGHFLQRHEGFAAGDQRLTDRLIHRHDPAQVDETNRARMLDGTKPGEHYCGDKATAIQDPTAFAAAFARGIEHPKVRAMFEGREAGKKPKEVSIPIHELLGADGHQDCIGYQLVPIDGSLNASRKYRNDWAKAVAAGAERPGPPPELEQIGSFEGGTIKFVLTPAVDPTTREVLTMYPDPPKKEET